MCLIMLVGPLLFGCNRDTRTSAPPERPGLFTIDTDLGPVDVLALNGEGGTRDIRFHVVYPDGHHAVRTLHMEVADLPDHPDGTRFIQSIRGDGVERLRITQSVPENAVGLDAVYEIGNERLRLVAFREGDFVRVRADLTRDGTERTWEQVIDRARTEDSGYVSALQASLADFYGQGPLRNNDDLSLYVAVLGSPDWSAYLDLGPLDPEGSGSTVTTERNIHRLCVASAVVGKVSCFVARFTPWALIPCIPATGINIACLVYNVSQLVSSPDPLPPLPRPCTCGCACSGD
jgi:hypothetical protein